ncbi:MAG: phosphatidylglycerophosphatase A [Methylophilaceae bacterium]
MTTSPDNQPSLKFLLAHPAHLLALGFGSGLAKKAPGTFGTLVGFPLYFFIPKPHMLGLAVLAALFILGCYVCDKTGKNLGVPDHGAIVWDEIVAMAALLYCLPFANWQTWISAFLLFRLFDIWKPYPISYFDTYLKNGFGVMLDDILAAAYALIVFVGVLWMSKTF